MGKPTSKIDLSGTHLPVLAKLLNVTNGAVLELGSGFNSTPLLYWSCKVNDRFFRSYENDKKWSEKLGDFTSYIENWEQADIDSNFWDIAFIDSRPAHSRHLLAIHLKNNARFVVCHDSDPTERVYGYWVVQPHFKYRYDFRDLTPNTTIFSNFEDPAKFFLDLR